MYKVKESIIRVNTKAFNEYISRFSEDQQEDKIQAFLDEIDTRPEVLAVYSTYDTFILFDRAKDMLDHLIMNMDFDKDLSDCNRSYFEFKVTTLYEFRYGPLGTCDYYRQIGQANEITGFSIDFKGVDV